MTTKTLMGALALVTTLCAGAWQGPLDLNGSWEFALAEGKTLETAGGPDFAATDRMSVPGCWDMQPKWLCKRGTGLYRRTFTLAEPVENAWIVVGGMGLRAQFAVDGKPVGGVQPFPWAQLEIPTGPLAAGTHTLFAALDNVLDWSTQKLALPYYDFYLYGGFYHGVKMVFDNRKLFVRTRDYKTGTVEIEAVNFAKGDFDATLVFDGAKEVKTSFRNFRATVRVPDFKLWSPSAPNLHTVTLGGSRSCATDATTPGGSRSCATATVTDAQERVPPVLVPGPWQVTFLNGRGAPSSPVTFDALTPWNEHADDGIRYYSGSAIYRKTIPDPRTSPTERLILDLGDVKNIATVTVNGKTFHVLWKPPYRVDITGAINCAPPAHATTSGTINCAPPAGGAQLAAPAAPLNLEIKITNLWPNRLIGDDALPCDAEYHARKDQKNKGGIIAIPRRVYEGKPSPTGRHTFTTWRLWKKSDKLLPSGLIGPVRLLH